MKAKLVPAIAIVFLTLANSVAAKADRVTWWPFQAIDTMKYSRDLAREKQENPQFNEVIDRQVKDIADLGATHVGIATPYDEEFLPFLQKWVEAARKYGLNVWFRGNWSGWEGWFDYPKINREEHLQKTYAFVKNNPDLFADGDIFTACPECENGGPGDPRRTGDIAGFRQFLISQYQQLLNLFRAQGKNVFTNYNSMNADVAKLVMDVPTTQALGGLVVIDHYVATPRQLASDISAIAASSGGKVVLGEFGVPIPGIHPQMSDPDQAQWLDEAFRLLVPLPQLSGISYWVNIGGSTQLWQPSGTPRQSAFVVSQYFSPPSISKMKSTNPFIPPPFLI